MIQGQRRPSANQQAVALEPVIIRIGQDAIDKIRADWVFMETDWASAEWQQSEGIIMNMIQSEFLKHEIWAVLPLGGSKINRLHKVLQDGIDMLHTRHPPCIPAHALHDNNLDTIKADVKSWEVKDDFPYAHRRPKQYLLDLKFTFTKLYERYKDKIESANDARHVISYSRWNLYIHMFFPGLCLACITKDVCNCCIRIDIQLQQDDLPFHEHDRLFLEK
jgi:hypothetical protein